MKKYKILQVVIALLFFNAGYGQGLLSTTGTEDHASPAIIVHDLGTRANGVYVGHGAGFNAANNISNTAVGTGALTTNTIAGANTAVGWLALHDNDGVSGGTFGSNNTAVGSGALQHTTGILTAGGGRWNSAVGANSLLANTSGVQNTAMGVGTLAQMTTQTSNSAFGFQAGGSFTSGNNNTFLGVNSGFNGLGASLSGDNNIAIGNNALNSISNGSDNIAIGRAAMNASSGGSNNVCIGNTANVPVANGSTSLSIQNSIFGINMGLGTSGVSIGVIPSQTGAGSLFPGVLCRLRIHGINNTIPSLQLGSVPFSGTNSSNQYLFVDGEGVVCRSTLPGSTGINVCSNVGNIPLVTNIGGSANMGCSQVFASSTLHGTVSIDNGSNANVSWTSGTAEEVSQTGTNNAPSTYVPGTNFVLYANGWVGAIGYLAVSDQTIKKNIKPIENPIDKIAKISGYTYEWDLNAKTTRKLDSTRQAGFLAQEILKVLPEAVGKCSDGLYSLNYNAIMPLLAEGIKEQQKEIHTLQLKITEQDAAIAELKNKINQLVPGNVIVKDDNFQITPNPVTGTSTVSYKMDASITNAVFIVYDLQGKMLKKYSVDANAKQGQVQISKKDFGNGMYILSLVSNNQEIQSKHFIISE